MVYADSSLLLKLYLREPETPAALAALSSASGPVSITALHLLEITNAIRRNLAAKRIRRIQALKALQTLRSDLSSGFYLRPVVDWEKVFRKAQGLSSRHAGKLAVRSLDLLHVALALELSAASSGGTQYHEHAVKGRQIDFKFLTFDDRQREAATAEGLITAF